MIFSQRALLVAQLSVILKIDVGRIPWDRTAFFRVMSSNTNIFYGCNTLLGFVDILFLIGLFVVQRAIACLWREAKIEPYFISNLISPIYGRYSNKHCRIHILLSKLILQFSPLSNVYIEEKKVIVVPIQIIDIKQHYTSFNRSNDRVVIETIPYVCPSSRLSHLISNHLYSSTGKIYNKFRNKHMNRNIHLARFNVRLVKKIPIILNSRIVFNNGCSVIRYSCVYHLARQWNIGEKVYNYFCVVYWMDFR